MKFKRIIYLISTTVLITVTIQVYRNVQNYQLNKQRFVNEVQQALDLSVEAYYADIARGDFFVFSTDKGVDTLDFADSTIFGTRMDFTDSVLQFKTKIPTKVRDWVHAHEKKPNTRQKDSTFYSVIGASTIGIDSLLQFSASGISRVDLRGEANLNDSSRRLQNFAKKIMISLTRDYVDFKRLDKFLLDELNRKNIDVKYILIHKALHDTTYSADPINNYVLTTSSKSTYLPRNQELSIQFENASLNILKRGAFDLLISLLISGAVIGSLLYLYRVITEQKQLAEIKNDLISNITHEFKTPIATVSTAIEAISNFNETNDPVKTAKYLDISSNQLSKLNGMVEKLLETASLDSDDLEIDKERTELVRFTQQIFEKFHLIRAGKKLIFQTELVEEWQEIDLFHMENALSNLVDNAIKYGGDEITVKLAKQKDGVIWQVTDNGGKIDKQQQHRIFDKFYRIPTGNVHDVKGFGIGLYYTKKIVEKHGGQIRLDVSSNTTAFTIQI